jgi:polyphosphate kinase
VKPGGDGRSQTTTALDAADDERQESPLTSDSRLFSRELSWLDYNERVLALAEDDARPALERAKFLAIFSRNLDEFFQIRVSGLRERAMAGVPGSSPDGMSPSEQLKAIREHVQAPVERQTRTFEREVRPLLKKGGIQILDWKELKKAQREELRHVFEERVYPVLTPLAVDPAHPFPYISDLSLNLAVMVRDATSDQRRFARVKIPPLLPRFLKVPGGRKFVPLEQVIAAHLESLFPGTKIVTEHPFRVTRDAEVEVEVDEAGDLLETLETLLRGRHRSPEAVRLEVAACASSVSSAAICT